MKSLSLILILGMLSLTACSSPQDTDAVETPIISSGTDSVDEAILVDDVICDQPHASFFPEYYPKKSYEALGYIRLQPLSHTGDALVYETYTISDWGLSFDIMQPHSACNEDLKIVYHPVMHNINQQLLMIPSRPMSQLIQKIDDNIDTDITIIDNCIFPDRGIQNIGYNNTGAIITTTRDDMFMIGRGEESFVDGMASGEEIAQLLCNETEHPNKFLLDPTSLVFVKPE